MSDEPVNQTAFTMDPETRTVPPAPPAGTQVEPSPKRQSSLPVLVAAVVGVVVVAAVAAAIFSSRPSTTPDLPTPVPVPTEPPVETASIRNEIAPDLKLIETLNPEQGERPFPPVDFTVRIKDPNIR